MPDDESLSFINIGVVSIITFYLHNKEKADVSILYIYIFLISVRPQSFGMVRVAHLSSFCVVLWFLICLSSASVLCTGCYKNLWIVCFWFGSLIFSSHVCYLFVSISQLPSARKHTNKQTNVCGPSKIQIYSHD